MRRWPDPEDFDDIIDDSGAMDDGDLHGHGVSEALNHSRLAPHSRDRSDFTRDHDGQGYPEDQGYSEDEGEDVGGAPDEEIDFELEDYLTLLTPNADLP